MLLPEVTIRFDGEDYYYNDSYTAKVRLRKGTRRTKLAADINVSGKFTTVAVTDGRVKISARGCNRSGKFTLLRRGYDGESQGLRRQHEESALAHGGLHRI